MCSVKVLNPKKGQPLWSSGYEVLKVVKGALLLKAPSGHEVRVKQERVRALTDEVPYEAVDSLPEKPKKPHSQARLNLPEQVEPEPCRAPMVARAAPVVSEKQTMVFAVRQAIGNRDLTWSQWCQKVYDITHE